MTERQRIFLLAAIMIAACVIAVTVTIFLLYRTEIEQSRARLRETAKSQARLIEAVARFDTRWSKDYPEGTTAATLRQVFDAHEQYEGFGETGEFTLARREGNLIVFLLRHRHGTVEQPEPIPMDSQLAEPMRRALDKLSGSVIGPDYRGVTVLAGYEPVQELDLGIVAKIDLAEIRAPFVISGLIAATLTFFIVMGSVALFRKVSNPIVGQLQAHAQSLERELKWRERAEDGLRRSQQNLARAQHISHLGSWEWDIGSDKTIWSDELYRIFGATPEQFAENAYEEFLTCVHPEDRESVGGVIRKTINNGQPFQIEYRIVRSDGEERIVHARGELTLDEASGPRIIGVAQDITERKQTEDTLRLREQALGSSRQEIRSLASRLLTAQEEERRHLARELHDGLNQRLAMLAVDIGMLKKQVRLQRLAMNLSDNVRSISHELHPSALEHLGLPSALEAHCAELSKGIGLQVKVTLRNLPEAIPSDVALCLYRVAQECLHNVARHSGVLEAKVALKGTNAGLKLFISDAGVGFDMEKAYKKETLGLISMEERVRLVNGTFSVRSIPEDGTELEVFVPLSKEGP
jgi:PAS domain S-box-containing protein